MFDKFFKDKQGKVVIWQFPNIWLFGWFASIIFERFDTQFNDFLHFSSIIFLTVFAVLELTSGVNYFRRTVGLVVLAYIAYSNMLS